MKHVKMLIIAVTVLLGVCICKLSMEANWRYVKKLEKFLPNELTTNQKYRLFEVPFSLVLCSNKKLFLDWFVMWDKK